MYYQSDRNDHGGFRANSESDESSREEAYVNRSYGKFVDDDDDDDDSDDAMAYRDYANAPTPAAATEPPKFRGGFTTHFPALLHAMLTLADVDGYSHICSWVENGRGFAVYDRQLFVKQVLPINFRQSHFASFQRQLNLYGFQRFGSITGEEGNTRGNTGRAASTQVPVLYYHAMFLRTRHDLCPDIQRATERELRVKRRRRMLATRDPDFSSYSPMPRITAKDIKIARNVAMVYPPSGSASIKDMLPSHSSDLYPQGAQDEKAQFVGQPHQHLNHKLARPQSQQVRHRLQGTNYQQDSNCQQDEEQIGHYPCYDDSLEPYPIVLSTALASHATALARRNTSMFGNNSNQNEMSQQRSSFPSYQPHDEIYQHQQRILNVLSAPKFSLDPVNRGGGFFTSVDQHEDRPKNCCNVVEDDPLEDLLTLLPTGSLQELPDSYQHFNESFDHENLHRKRRRCDYVNHAQNDTNFRAMESRKKRCVWTSWTSTCGRSEHPDFPYY